MKKMKNIIKSSLFLYLLLTLSGCSDYLDIVPDERPSEADAFRTPNAALGYLYSCYSYLPNERDVDNSIDFMTSDEVVTSFEHKTFAKFPRGEYTASNPVISYWNDLYKGIRQCYIFINSIDSVKDIDQNTRNSYKAEAKFLIGYYHFLLIRMYGPVVVADHQFDINLPASEYPIRSTYDESVNFAVGILDEAASDLPAAPASADYFGRATSVIAKSVKSRLLLYAASPLFNGGGGTQQSFFADFKNAKGENLISPTYDKAKWTRAAVAAKEAIDAAEGAGYALYSNSTANSALPSDPIEKDLRYVYIDKANKEVIFPMTRTESNYAYQNNVTPYLSGNDGVAYNGVGPTISFLQEFYTKNGLPIDKDPSYDYAGRFNRVNTPLGNTLSLNLNREPRFNAWISYHNSYYEIIRGSANKVLTQFRANDAHGIKGRSNNYSPTGYLVKKGVAPLLNQSQLQVSVQYAWPLLRLSELYLNYAEALISSGEQLPIAKLYIDKVRVRAGIPTVDNAWDPIGGANDVPTLTRIVRQERGIEFFLENQRFWDLRRWQVADQYLNKTLQGMNIQGTNDNDFFTITNVQFPRAFFQRNYLMPIPQDEINKNESLIQNPGY
jgi:hypothetical protein